MEIDYTWNIFGMSYSGNKAVMKKFKKISGDLYSYYGVTCLLYTSFPTILAQESALSNQV